MSSSLDLETLSDEAPLGAAEGVAYPVNELLGRMPLAVGERDDELLLVRRSRSARSPLRSLACCSSSRFRDGLLTTCWFQSGHRNTRLRMRAASLDDLLGGERDSDGNEDDSLPSLGHG